MDNTFTNQAQIGQNKWWQYTITLAILFAGVTFSMMLINKLIFPALPENSDFDQIIGYLGTSIIGFLGILILFFTIKHIHKRPFYSLNYTKRLSLKELFEGIFICVILIVVSQGLFGFNSFQNFNYDVINSRFLIVTLIAFICISIQSYFEELLFRGYLLQGFALIIRNKWLLFAIIGLLFAILHGGRNIQGLLELFLVGSVFSYVVFKRGNLFFVTGVHLVYNYYNMYLQPVFNLETTENTTNEWYNFFPTLLLIALLVLYILFKKTVYNKK